MTEPTAEPTAEPPVARRSGEIAVGVIVVLVLVAGFWLWRFVVGANAQHARDAAETSAWVNRDATNVVLRDTAKAAGLDVRLFGQSVNKLTCERRDDRAGFSYQLDSLIHDGPVDSAAVVQRVIDYWDQQGLQVPGGVPSPLPSSGNAIIRASAETASGAIVVIGSGPGATTLSGESMCALIPGGPTDWSTWTPTPLASYGK